MIFPPAFLDSSSCWNTNHNQLQLQQLASSTHLTTTPSPAATGGGGGGAGGGNNHPQDGSMVTAAGGGGGGGEGDGDGGPNKPMSMSERARLARVPQPEPGLNCPRCDSTNTKFCYFNNYSLTQPRHFCRACRRYWTRGGALRNVPVGGGYRRHAKRSTKPKATASGAVAAAAGTSSATSTTPSSTTCTGSATAAVPPGMQYSMFSNSAPPHGRFADGFDPASLGLSFPARLLFGDSNGSYATDGGVHHGHQGNGNGMEQWASMAQMQGFPFLHAMDHQMAGNPPPTTMAAMQGMFHLGLQSGGGGNGEDGGEHQFHHHAATPAAKRDQHHQQQQQHHQEYPSSRGMYGDIVNGGGGYNFYTTASNAAGN